jgi:hypothetical protein
MVDLGIGRLFFRKGSQKLLFGSKRRSARRGQAEGWQRGDFRIEVLTATNLEMQKPYSGLKEMRP